MGGEGTQGAHLAVRRDGATAGGTACDRWSGLEVLQVRHVVGERRRDGRHAACEIRPRCRERTQQQGPVVCRAREAPHQAQQLRRQAVLSQRLRHTGALAHPPKPRDGVMAGGDDPRVQSPLRRHVERHNRGDCAAARHQWHADRCDGLAWYRAGDERVTHLEVGAQCTVLRGWAGGRVGG